MDQDHRFSANLPLTPSGADFTRYDVKVERGGHETTEVHCGPTGAPASSTEASMANLYFEEPQFGSRSTAGPYVLSKDEIIRFAKQYDPIPRHIAILRRVLW
jgi:hypothetical protein